MTTDVFADKSTNVRAFDARSTRKQSERILVQPVRTGLRALTAISPKLSARVVQHIFSAPRRPKRPDWEKVLLTKAHPFPVVFGANVVRAWCWGSGPTIVLMHGWEGRGGQIGTFVEPLVDAGFRVVAFDAPAHGDSTGHLATAVDFAMALRAVSDWVGDVQAVIAHSMGALATTIALHQGLALEKIVFIGAPESPKGATDMLARILDLPPSVLRLLQKRLATMLNTTWEALTDGSYLDELDVPLLILHDRMDKDVPWSAAVKLSERWKRSELVLTEGLGHRRILKDPEVIAKAVDFLRPLADRPPPNPWPALQIDLAP